MQVEYSARTYSQRPSLSKQSFSQSRLPIEEIIEEGDEPAVAPEASSVTVAPRFDASDFIKVTPTGTPRGELEC